ncbi:hypothetical protein FZW96_07380 [Bacillus sp. BGMRC 2118]|nr:hypothetical protein FZW96_07380 [Bacillus sp. BGMRC 2118]
MNNQKESFKKQMDQYISSTPLLTQKDKHTFQQWLDSPTSRQKVKKPFYLPVLVTIIVFLGFAAVMVEVLSSKQDPLLSANEEKEEVVGRSLGGYAYANGEIFDLIYQLTLRKDGVTEEYIRSNHLIETGELILLIKEEMKELEGQSVSKRYRKSYDKLLGAYEQLYGTLADFQQALLNHEPTHSLIDEIISDYEVITVASDELFNLYRSNHPDVKIDEYESVIGKEQTNKLYIEYTSDQIESLFFDIEDQVLPLMNQKDYNNLSVAMLNFHNEPYHVTGGTELFYYMKEVPVPEQYTEEHEELLQSCEMLFSYVKETKVTEIDEDFIEGFKSHYEEIQQTFEEWKKETQ